MVRRIGAWAALGWALLALAPAATLPAARAAVRAAGRRRPAPVLLAAGDVQGCVHDRPAGQAFATAKLIRRHRGTLAMLGDADQGQHASRWAMNHCYGPTWGQAKARTQPALGNHDYQTPHAAGFFDYFHGGRRGRGYYFYQLGSWHVVVLNSSCAQIGGCGRGSREERWLRADLASHRARCILAYWHHPLFTSAVARGDTEVRALWEDLYRAGADVILNGHHHQYERFAPQTPAGARNRAHGIREFVVGTGGARLHDFLSIKANSQVRNDTTYGILRLTLGRGWYSWKFLPVAHHYFTDSGRTRCH